MIDVISCKLTIYFLNFKGKLEADTAMFFWHISLFFHHHDEIDMEYSMAIKSSFSYIEVGNGQWMWQEKKEDILELSNHKNQRRKKQNRGYFIYVENCDNRNCFI